MGRTLQTTNQLILTEQAAFTNFRRALRPADQELLDALFAAARQHAAAISLADHALPLESMLLAMLLEQQRRLLEQQRRLQEQQRRLQEQQRRLQEQQRRLEQLERQQHAR